MSEFKPVTSLFPFYTDGRLFYGKPFTKRLNIELELNQQESSVPLPKSDSTEDFYNQGKDISFKVRYKPGEGI
jgi:hypothetical protein